MADVFDGYDTSLARPVAVKLLRHDMVGDAELRTRFELEARAAARLSHPNVVAIYDTGDDAGTPFIVMERLPGETLADHLAAGPLDQAWVWQLAGDVLAALGAAHGAGIVHRDVKPGNVLVSPHGSAKVADFGIAKSVEVAGPRVTATGLVLGTPAYVAPERLNGRPATPRSDLYSVGVLLYEALAGARPFAGDTAVAVAHAVQSTRPPPLADLRPDVEPRRAAVVDRAMHKDPAARPASAEDMAASLGVATGGAATAAPAPPGPPASPRRRPGGAVARHRRAAVAFLGLALVVLVAVAVSSRTGGGGEPGRGAGIDRQGLSARIEDLAGRVRSGDGPKGPEAGDRLEVVAAEVRGGGGRDAAEELLADAAQWNGDGRLSDPATVEMEGLLRQVPGVDGDG